MTIPISSRIIPEPDNELESIDDLFRKMKEDIALGIYYQVEPSDSHWRKQDLESWRMRAFNLYKQDVKFHQCVNHVAHCCLRHAEIYFKGKRG